jgi:hypothetical protein
MKYAETVGIPTTSMTISQLILQLCWMDRHVPLLVSESGIGKTAVVRQMADAFDAQFVLYSLAHCEPPDVCGPQFPSNDDTFINLRDRRIPFKGYAGEDKRALLFFDEPNRAEMTTLNAVFPAWAERRLGVHEFGPNVRVVSAMNPPDGEYAVTGQFTSDPAMRRRVCLICVEHSPTETLRYAKDPTEAVRLLPWEDWTPEMVAERKTRPWHPAVIEFLTGSPDEVLDVKGRDAGKVYGCPATWEAVSDTFYTADRLTKDATFKPEDAALTRAFQVKLAGHVGQRNSMEVWDIYVKSAEVIDPIEMMTKFATDKKLKAKIDRLVARGEIGQLLSLNNKMAGLWQDAKIEPKIFAENVAKYIFVTPPQVGKTLLDAINMAGGMDGSSSEALEFSRHIVHMKEFKQWRERLAEDTRIAHESMTQQQLSNK